MPSVSYIEPEFSVQPTDCEFDDIRGPSGGIIRHGGQTDQAGSALDC